MSNFTAIAWQEPVIFWWNDDEDEDDDDDDGDDDDDQIGRVMASTLISSRIDCGFNAGRIKPLTIKLVCVASRLQM
jgi:hypothetical protein